MSLTPILIGIAMVAFGVGGLVHAWRHRASFMALPLAIVCVGAIVLGLLVTVVQIG